MNQREAVLDAPAEFRPRMIGSAHKGLVTMAGSNNHWRTVYCHGMDIIVWQLTTSFKISCVQLMLLVLHGEPDKKWVLI